MNAYKVQTVLVEDGALVLQNLPFQAGDAVEVIIRERSKKAQDKGTRETGMSNPYPSQGKQPYQYNELFEPTDMEYLRGISAIMGEWESEADEYAYSDL